MSRRISRSLVGTNALTREWTEQPPSSAASASTGRSRIRRGRVRVGIFTLRGPGPCRFGRAPLLPCLERTLVALELFQVEVVDAGVATGAAALFGPRFGRR